MRLDELQTLYVENRTGKRYRLREASADAFLTQANASFDRLPPKQKEKVAQGWNEYLVTNKELTTKVFKSFEDAQTSLKLYRFLAQTNLFFLCKLLEKYNEVTEETHEEICNEFFVQKDPTKKTFEQFAYAYTEPLKRRLLLTPRGGFKSSLNMADSVQWIICFPAVTMLILTGTLTLATDFVGEIKQHFTFEETGEPDDKGKSKFGPRKLMDKQTGNWSDSLFQVLFPEHCTPPGDGKQTEFQTPAGGDDKEPTVRAASIEQALSGMHFGVLKLDDVVTNENSLTFTRLEAVNKQISINEAMLHPYGFFDVIGTWYDEKDYYGITIAQEEKFALEQGGFIKGSVDSGRFESGVFFKVYLRAAWWPTDEALAQNKIKEELTESDVTLWFPKRLTYGFLKQKEQTDPYFAIKYLNNPRVLHQVKFPRELLLRRTIPHNQLPQQGIIVTTIDTAYSVKSWADFTVIITALIFGGRFYIINMVRGRFNEDALPAVIASTAYKWKPKRIAIEESVGVKWFSKELRREMEKLQISVPIEYVSLGFGNKTKSKKLKAKPVVRLLGDERMLFSNSCEGLQEIYTELEKFTGTSDDAHDDIVSALSLMAEQFGGYADMDQKVNYINTQYVADRQSKERHDLIYGLGKYARYNAEQIADDDHPMTVYQMAEGRKYREEPDIDPLAELTG